MKEIGIVEILELINKCLPCCYYSILFMDASFLPGPELSGDMTVYEKINNDIKNKLTNNGYFRILYEKSRNTVNEIYKQYSQ